MRSVPGLKSASKWMSGLLVVCVGVVGAFLGANGKAPTPGGSSEKDAKQSVKAAMQRLPLTFQENRGQAGGDVRFLSRGAGYTFWMSPTSTTLALAQLGGPDAKEKARAGKPLPASVMRMRMVGANPKAKVRGAGDPQGRTNYLVGNDKSKWLKDIPNFGRVRYEGIYSGVDLEYYGNQQELEHDFIVKPGASPATIRLAYDGVTGVDIAANGELHLKTRNGVVEQKKPFSYQVVGDERREVPSKYTLLARNEIGFEVGDYDPSKPLVIDPVLRYSTYIGGSVDDYGFDIDIDSNANVYITGYTGSYTQAADNDPGAIPASEGGPYPNIPSLDAFPTQGGLGNGDDPDDYSATYDLNNPNNGPESTWSYSRYDAFVTKLNANGNGLVFSTYLGAEDDDYGFGIAVGPGNTVYVTGRTTSLFWPLLFPVQANSGGGADAFLVRLNEAGNGFFYSSYLGGSGFDQGRSIAVDNTGNAYVAGITGSTDFPVFQAAQGALAGGLDVFVASVNASGSTFNYSTYLGGTGDESGGGAAIAGSGHLTYISEARTPPWTANIPDGNGVFPNGLSQPRVDPLGIDFTVDIDLDGQSNAYVTGATDSADFFTSPAAVQTVHAGGYDAFVTKYATEGTITYSTFMGGSADDAGRSVAVQSTGEAYITGFTDSADYPTVGELQTDQGSTDAFVTKLSGTGETIIYSTYLGGDGVDIGNGIAVSAGGQAYITGTTLSNAPSFPTVNYSQANRNSGRDMFATKLRPNGIGYEYSTFVGGAAQPGDDRGMGIVVDARGQAYVVGMTASFTYPTTINSFRQSISWGTGNYGAYPRMDAFVTKLHSPPFAPSDLTTTDVQQTSISLAWTDNSDNEDGFEIERRLANGGAWALIGAVGQNQVTFVSMGLVPTTLYQFRVRGFNTDGINTYFGPYSNQLEVSTLPEEPDAPNGFTAVALDTVRIRVTWVDRADNEESYILERRQLPGGVYSVINGGNPLPGSVPATQTGGTMQYTDTGLTPSTTYEYRLRARNVAGDSAPPHPTAQATTLDPAPTTVPNLTATAVSNSAADLVWTYANTDAIGFKIYRQAPTDPGFVLIRTTSNTNTTFTDTGLDANTEYCYQVRAYNASGDGPLSNQSCTTTLPDPPAAPSNLTATLVVPTSVDLNWTDNSFAPEEDGFKIEVSTDAFNTQQNTSLAADVSAGAATLTVASAAGIAPAMLLRVDTEIMSIISVSGTTLTVRRGHLGSTDAGHTAGAVVRVGSVQLISEAPANTVMGGVPGPAPTFSISGLLHNTVYHFRVLSFARNMAGDSDSTPSNPACIITRPADPTNLAVTIPTAAANGHNTVTVTWTDNNPVTNTASTFLVERAPDAGGMPGAFAATSGTPTGVQGGTFTLTDTGLASNTRYHYRVSAVNTRPPGCVDPVSGGGSAVIGPQSGLTRPAAPTINSVVAIPLNDPAFVPDSTGLRITWTDNSASPTAFRVERATDNAFTQNLTTVLTTMTGDATVFDDLTTNGNRTYFYRVVAFNATGDSLASNTGSALTFPSRPANVRADASTDPGAPSKIRVTVTWVDASFAPTAFQVEMSSTGPMGTYSPVPGSPTASGATSISVSGLSPDTSYCFRVRGVNATGGGEWSVIACPAVGPTGLTATALSDTEIGLTWEDRSDNESDFRIERVTGNSFATGINPTNFLAGGPNVTSFTNSGLTPNTTYTYRVIAISANGNSAPSREAGATTFRTPPADVTGLTAMALSSSSIQLDWTHGGVNATGFKIERKEEPAGSFSLVTTAGAALRTYTDTGRKSNTTYTYRVTATNMGSDASMPPSASALTYPATPAGLAVSTLSSTELSLNWNDNSSTPSDFKIERKEEPAGSFAMVGTTTAPATTFMDSGLAPATTYTYRVIATNATGDSAPSNEASGMTLPEPPTAPSGLTVTTISQSSLRLNWTDASDNETGFKIERSPNGVSGWQQVGATGMNATAFQDLGLLAGTTYHYRVLANNAGGDSTPSNVASGTTLPNPPSAPSGLTVTVPAAPAGASQLVLNWNDNSNNETGFKVERSTDNFGSPANTTLVTTTAANVSTYTNTGLTAGTTYYYRVRATNAAGDSGNSNVANGTTLPAVPAAPSALTVTPVSSTSLRIDWTDNSANETSFKLERSADGMTFTQVTTTAANVTTYTDGGLTADTTYHYRVRASNAGGDSGYSNVGSGTTFPLPPAAPGNLVVTVVSSASLKLDWTDNSSNETSFKIQRKVAGGAFAMVGSVGANILTFTDTGLQADTAYTYRVFASHGGGDSPASNEASGTTLPAPPTAPSSLNAMALSQTQIRLDWTDASNNETGFKIERSTDGTNFQSVGMVAMNVLIFTDSGLTANTAYTYRVKATNAGGDSAPSPTASATTLPNPPTAPANLLANALSGTAVQLAWVDNSNNESGFSVERRTGAGMFAEIARPMANATSHQDTGLTPGVSYTYRVRAFNAGGNSAFTNEATVTTTPTPPSAPNAISVTALSKSSLRFTWADNSDNEASFVIERRTNGGAFAFLVSRGANVTSYDDNGLSANTTYTYRVQAVNGGGSSVFSNEVSGTTLPEPPAAPTNLQVAVHSLSSVGATWNDNSNNETGFRIMRRVGANKNEPFVEVATVGANVTSYTDTNVELGETYAYKVFAFNSGGDSAPTDEVAVTVSGSGRLRLSVARLTFPKTKVGQSKSKSFRIKNVGNGPLLGNVGEPLNTYVVTSGGGSFSLAPGQSRVVTVTFTPTAAGRATRSLTITSTDGVSPSVSVSLGGLGVVGRGR